MIELPRLSALDKTAVDWYNDVTYFEELGGEGCAAHQELNKNVTELDSPEPVETPAETHTTTRHRALLPALAAAVIIVDQLTKLVIESTLPLYESWAPIPAIAAFFQISHVSNTGMAFGLFPAGSMLFAAAPVVVSLAILAYNYTLQSDQRLLRVALGLQLGGALGNLIDRVRIGHVTDFLDFGPWPVFNLADLSVVSGAIVLAWYFWQEGRERNEAEQQTTRGSESDQEFSELVDEPDLIDEWSVN